jgi:hypothetical protein
MYSEQLLGEAVTTKYYVHPQHGLIAGAYVAPYTFGNSCWEVYSKFKEALMERYPGIRPDVQENNESRSLDMCGAITINRGSAGAVWDDPVNGARAYVQINNDPREVHTMYFSVQGMQIIDALNAEQRRDRF